MGILSRVINFFNSIESRASVNDDRMFINTAIANSYGTKSGVNVNADSALAASTVFACVDILSGTLASLPLMLYRRRGDNGKDIADSNSLYDLLHTQPNKYQTSFQFRRMMMTHMLLRGICYAYIEYNGLGEVMSLIPMHPDRMRVEKDKEGNVWYNYRLSTSDMGSAGSEIRIPSQYIWSITDFETDMFNPKSRITLARESIGLSLAAEQYGSQFFGNSAVASSVLKHPMKLNDNARTNLKNSLAQFQASKRFTTMILEEGMELQSIGLNNDNAQFLETRVFQTKEIARWYNVPLVMLGEADKSATFASAEQFFLSFATHTMLPWCVNWEQSISKDLLTLKERKKIFAEFNMNGLMRGDLSSRYNAFKIGREWGWLSANDIRRLENMNPLGTEGDEYLRPMNMTLAGTPVVDPTKEPKKEDINNGEDSVDKDEEGGGDNNGEDGKTDV